MFQLDLQGFSACVLKRISCEEIKQVVNGGVIIEFRI